MPAKEKDNMTPEEKLLKIIENPQEPADKIDLGAREKSINARQLLSRFKGLRINKDAILEYANIWTANKALAGVCVILTAFWIFDFVNGGLQMNKRLDALIKASAVSRVMSTGAVFAGADLKEVLAQARRRNIFTLLPPKQEVIQTQALEQAITNFKLVGIIWSDAPQAMIEDAKAGKTNLINENEMLGDFRVKKILRDRVIISKDKMEWELR